MKNLLVYLESTGSNVSKSSLPVLTAARTMKSKSLVEKITVLIIGGTGSAEAAASASNYGVDEIYYCESEVLEKYNAIDYSYVLDELISSVSPSFVLGLSSAKGKDFFPRSAALLDAPQVSEVIEFLETNCYRRPTFAGNVIADVMLEGDIQFITVRGSAFDQPSVEATTTQIHKFETSLQKNDLIEVLSFDNVKSERPELGEADIVVSGGRALKSKENFESILFPLADALGAAVGASRAAVDSGYAPNDWQVGQTGKIVAPKLYIAVGISGAVQHLAGMKDSKVIVAINKDPEAPIFEIADYFIVGDLFELVPQMLSAINS